MGSLSTDERIRARIRGLYRHGDGVKIEAYSAQRRAPEPGLSAKNLSYFLHDRRKAPLSIADLEDIALYYNLTPDDLYYPTRTHKGLSGVQQRLLVAYAAAPAEAQAAALTLLELADRGAAPRGAPRRRFAGGHAVATLDTTRPSPAWLDPTGTA
jgi:hypothetical protein